MGSREGGLTIDPIIDACLRLHGELDIGTAPELEAALAAAIHGQPRLEIDLGGLTFMDSSGLNAIAHAAGQMRSAGGELVLSHAKGAVRRVLDIALVSSWPGITLE